MSEISNSTMPAMADYKPRLVRCWWDTDYPVIAQLDEKWDLIAHPNGPAMTDGDTLSSIDTHPDDFRETMMVKMKAQAAWREYSWALLKKGFYPPNDPALATRGLESAPENHAGDGQPSGLPAAHGSASSIQSPTPPKP